MTDAEMRQTIRKALQPFLFEPMTETLRKAITEALHLEGVPLAAGESVHLDLSNGDIVMQLADGRTFRFGDANNFAGRV